MRVVIVRHGKAEADPPSGRDEDRRLKKRGRRQALWLGEHFAAQPPALILSSGHERAIATATLIHERCGAALRREARLELGHRASILVDVIVEHSEAAATGGLMLVGHNPQLGQLVGVLAQGLPMRQSDLRTGEALVLEIEAGAEPGGAMVVSRLRMPEDD